MQDQNFMIKFYIHIRKILIAKPPGPPSFYTTERGLSTTLYKDSECRREGMIEAKNLRMS